MEDIIGQKMRPPIQLKKFLEMYKELLHSTEFSNLKEYFKSSLDFSSQTFEHLKERCSLQHLKNGSHLAKCPTTQEERTLETVKLLRKTKEYDQGSPFKRSREIYKMAALQTSYNGQKLSDLNQIVVTVRVYRPARAIHVGRNLEKPVFAEEFECLGSNYLVELRDKISCVCAKERFFDISCEPDIKLPIKHKDPAYFFIVDTFYNDTRNPLNDDYSEVIRNWAKTAIGLKDIKFKVSTMETTQFNDLTVSLGFPNLYQHHGNCEHVFTISQVTLIDSVTCNKAQYPRLTSYGLYNNRPCNMCAKRTYSFIVSDSDQQLQDPAYLCEQCFYNYNYIDGKKVGNFKAYRVNRDPQINTESETE